MMYYTHLLFGLLVSLITIRLINIEEKLLFVSLVMLFSLLPDIDETRSRIGRKSKIISKIINLLFGHRKFIHTIWIPILLFILFNLVNFEVALAILIGYLSHLFMDAITKKGIMPLYPLLRKRINGPFRTNSLTEKFIAMLFVVLNIYLILV